RWPAPPWGQAPHRPRGAARAPPRGRVESPAWSSSVSLGDAWWAGRGAPTPRSRRWRSPCLDGGRRRVGAAAQKLHGLVGEVLVDERRGVHDALHDALAHPELLLSANAIGLHLAVHVHRRRRGAPDYAL